MRHALSKSTGTSAVRPPVIGVAAMTGMLPVEVLSDIRFSPWFVPAPILTRWSRLGILPPRSLVSSGHREKNLSTSNHLFLEDLHVRQAHIREALSRVGGQAKVARLLSELSERPMDPSAPAQWIRRGSVPVEFCLPLRRLSDGAFDPHCVRRFWPMEKSMPQARVHAAR